MAFVGEQIDGGEDEVCGVIVSVRYNGDVIQIWNRHADNKEFKNRLVRRLKSLWELPPFVAMDYKRHFPGPVPEGGREGGGNAHVGLGVGGGEDGGKRAAWRAARIFGQTGGGGGANGGGREGAREKFGGRERGGGAEALLLRGGREGRGVDLTGGREGKREGTLTGERGGRGMWREEGSGERHGRQEIGRPRPIRGSGGTEVSRRGDGWIDEEREGGMEGESICVCTYLICIPVYLHIFYSNLLHERCSS